VLRGSDRGFALETASHPLARRVRANIATRLGGPLTRLRAVRSAIFALFSQIWIAYPHSAAVADERIRRAGPRPNERAPFGRFEVTHQRASVFDVCSGARPDLRGAPPFPKPDPFAAMWRP
jgi:hypothetical protein